VKTVVSPGQLAEIVDNPQALVNVEAQAQLQGLFEGMGSQGTVLFEQLLTTLRNALNSALVQVFTVFLIVTLLGLLANCFLKGVPDYPSKRDVTTIK